MKCFVLMPFDNEFDDVYETIRKVITSDTPIKASDFSRLDKDKVAGLITEKLLRKLQEAAICIADLTGPNPNVMWEVGYAMALETSVIAITQDIKTIPFNIFDLKTIPYNRSALKQTLQDDPELVETVKATLRNRTIPTKPDIVPKRTDSEMTIAVTGSLESSSEGKGKCESQVEYLLSPYLGKNTRWLCGSFGVSDECALEYLLKHKQNVMVVGYHGHDISNKILKLVKESKIPFVDATREQVPKGVKGPSKRDLVFLRKADLSILLWNGKSTAIIKLINFFADYGINHIVGYI